MDQVNQKTRKLKEHEYLLIRHLLSISFPGRDVIIEQISHAEVKQIDSDGSLAFIVKTDKKAPVKSRVPTEGEFEDSDGVTIHILLHVVDGIVNELEFFKEDSSKVITYPQFAALRLFHPFLN